MPYDQMRKYMAPDFQAQAAPQLEWMPWEQNNDTANMGNIVDQLKQRQSKPKGAAGSAIGGVTQGMQLNPGGAKGSL